MTAKKLKSPITDLVAALMKDESYYTTWKANLAMSFQDAFTEGHKKHGIHHIANEAAERFLKNLMGFYK